MPAIESILPSRDNYIAPRPERALLIGYFDPRGISTVPEILASVQRLSVFSVVCLNLFDHRFDSGNLKLNPEVDLLCFDIVVVHNSVAYNPANVTSLDSLLTRKFVEFPGVKVLFKQDENHRFRETAKAIASMKFDIVLTCLPGRELPKIYPAALVGDNVRFVPMLTGYITPSLRARFPASGGTVERSIDIGYRGSIQPLEFGRLCYEKRQIGDEVKRRLEGRGFSIDISSRWEDRFGGEAWFDFLTRCNCILGVESGASIFDLDGDLDRRVQGIVERLGPVREDTAYCESFLDALRDLEGNVVYNQVSPRHFEAAACGALQIMYPGEYSGIFLAGRHYLSLARDFSDLDDVVEQARDPVFRRRIVECAFDEIVMNRDYWIESFVARLDESILQCLEEKGGKRKERVLVKEDAHHGLLLAPHRSHLDPRLRWILEGAVGGMTISLMGLELGGAQEMSPLAGLDGFLGDQPLVAAEASWLTLISSMVGSDPAGNAALRELLELERSRSLHPVSLCERYGASTSSARLDDFRWYLTYLLDVTRSLVMPALALRGLQFVVAADLPALPAALILKAVLGTKVLYDAHEYWAENDGRAEPFEIAFWQGVERRLVPHADLCQVVSPGLAELLSNETGCRFDSVPNCTPKGALGRRSESPRAAVAKPGTSKVRFLFQGLLTPGRGLEELLHVWTRVPDNAQLCLRGPEGDFKNSLVRMASDLGLSSEAVVFLPAVSEDELVSEATGFDVGLIPYPPSNTNNANCCPNKMAQYMAGGLAILANDTSYVRQIVTAAECGLVVDFGRADLLVERIEFLASQDAERSAMAASAQSYFLAVFNWESVSSTMYRRLLELVADKPTTALSIWPVGPFSVYRQPVTTADTAGRRAQTSERSPFSESPTDRRANGDFQHLIHRLSRAVWRRLPELLRKRLRPLKSWATGRGEG
jgi:glycosyltransferase involved in cell wall biosynthesis